MLSSRWSSRKMSGDGAQLLGGFLAERLGALLQEILDAVSEAVSQYRDEAVRTQRENENLRRQLRDFLLLEGDTKWLRSPLGLKASQQPGDEQEDWQHTEEPDISGKQSHANSSKQMQKPGLSFQFLSAHNKSTARTVLSTRDGQLSDTQEPVVKSEASPEEVLVLHHRSSPTLDTLDVPSLQEEPQLAPGIKLEPEEHKVTEPEVQADTSEIPNFAGDKPGFMGPTTPPLVTECTNRPQTRQSQKLWQEKLTLTGDDTPAMADSGGQPVHRCPRCAEVFKNVHKLQLHLEQKQKSYACDWCCKSFAQSADLRRHLRTHTGERPHRCNFCSKSFSQQGNLRRHLRIHTGERPYSCPFCCRSFSDGNTLKKHKRTHLYGCLRCYSSFNTPSGLQQHLQTNTCCVADS